MANLIDALTMKCECQNCKSGLSENSVDRMMKLRLGGYTGYIDSNGYAVSDSDIEAALSAYREDKVLLTVGSMR